MIAARITLTTLSNLAAGPLAWLSIVFLLASWPAVALAVPLGIRPDSSVDPAWFYEIVFMGVIIGSMLGTAVLHRLSRLISHASSRSVLTGEMLSLITTGLLFGMTATLPALLMGGVHPGLFSGEVLLRLALGLANAAALGCVLLRLRPPAGVLPWLLCALILLASLLLPQPVPTRSLVTVAAALLSAAWLLDHPPGRTA
jgi:hypothetical protein